MPKTAWEAFTRAIKPNKWLYILVLAFIFIGNSVAYSLPYILKLVVDLVLELERVVTFQDLMPYIILVLVILVSQELFFRSAHLFEIILNNRVVRQMYPLLFSKLLDRPGAYFENRFAGELAKRVEQIVTSIGHFISHFPWYVGMIVPALISSTILLYIAHPFLSLAYICTVTFFFICSYPLLRRQYFLSEELTNAAAEYDGRRLDVLGNIALVQSFAATDLEKKLCQSDTDVVAKKLWSEEAWFLLNKILQGVTSVGMAGILIVLSFYLFTRDQITVGDFVLVVSAIPVFSSIVWQIGDNILVALRNFASMTEATLALRADIETLPEGVRALQAAGKNIVFESVSFRYNGTSLAVLENLTMSIKPGQKVGIVGSSGAGKSTLVKLLLRQHDANAGKIMIGGCEITDFSLSSLRDQISFVPQETTMFHRSLLENIQYAKPEANLEEIIAVSKKAHTHEFIQHLPKQYDTMVGERGVKLSGGQRQRVAIARAMLKDAPILVLDEATSALDGESELIVQQGFSELFRGRTVIAIAHRLSTLREMDRIIVLENGQVIEDGSPSELLKIEKGVFKEKWEQQKDGFV